MQHQILRNSLIYPSHPSLHQSLRHSLRPSLHQSKTCIIEGPAADSASVTAKGRRQSIQPRNISHNTKPPNLAAYQTIADFNILNAKNRQSTSQATVTSANQPKQQLLVIPTGTKYQIASSSITVAQVSTNSVQNSTQNKPAQSSSVLNSSAAAFPGNRLPNSPLLKSSVDNHSSITAGNLHEQNRIIEIKPENEDGDTDEAEQACTQPKLKLLIQNPRTLSSSSLSKLPSNDPAIPEGVKQDVLTKPRDLSEKSSSKLRSILSKEAISKVQEQKNIQTNSVHSTGQEAISKASPSSSSVGPPYKAGKYLMISTKAGQFFVPMTGEGQTAKPLTASSILMQKRKLASTVVKQPERTATSNQNPNVSNTQKRSSSSTTQASSSEVESPPKKLKSAPSKQSEQSYLPDKAATSTAIPQAKSIATSTASSTGSSVSNSKPISRQ